MERYYGERTGGIRLAPILIGLAAIAFFMLKGCQEGPFGRRQLVGMSVHEESALGAQAFSDVIRQSRVVPPGPLTEACQRVANRLIAAARTEEFQKRTKVKTPDFRWEMRVVQSPQVNAFCLPGGKIVVYTGILPVCQTEAGLATVMGHEIGHALAHHGAERMGQQQLIQIGQMAAGSSIGDLSPESQRQIMMVLGAGAQYGLMLPFSRSHESEADRLGLYLMSIAGYNPLNAPKFWQRMGQVGGARPPEFASTHPSHERRAADLEHWQAEVMPLYQAAPKAPGAEDRLPY